MENFLGLVPVAIYLLVGFISLAMAAKCLSSKEFLSFHKKAAGKSWEEIDNNVQQVILTLLRITGFGFLTVSALLIIAPVAGIFVNSLFYRYFIPATALVFCAGLAVSNFLLHQNTKSDTPWKGSVLAAGMIILGIIISVLQDIF